MPVSHGSALGEFIREQRLLAQLSLREMARLTHISNAYLSQVERGLHEPSLRVLHAVSDALGVPMQDLVRRADPSQSTSQGQGQYDGPREATDVERAIKQEPRLSSVQKEALLSVFRGFLEASPGPEQRS